jgi:hypothetical protein
MDGLQNVAGGSYGLHNFCSELNPAIATMTLSMILAWLVLAELHFPRL